MVQYELGLANFGIMPGSQDLKLALYGMINFVTVDAWEDQFLQPVLDTALGIAPTSGLTLNDLKQNGTIKTKFGIDAEYFLTDWFALGARADHVRAPQQGGRAGVHGAFAPHHVQDGGRHPRRNQHQLLALLLREPGLHGDERRRSGRGGKPRGRSIPAHE